MAWQFSSMAKAFALTLGLTLGASAAASVPAQAGEAQNWRGPTAPSVGYDQPWRHGRGWDRGWRGNRGWDRGWDRGWRHERWRDARAWDRPWRYDRPWRRPYWQGSGVSIGFGIGVPAYRYYSGPRYYVDDYAPPVRRVYRARGGHTSWCAARYRSYRAWDNTFQPYYGPRRQCLSPYR